MGATFLADIDACLLARFAAPSFGLPDGGHESKYLWIKVERQARHQVAEVGRIVSA
jgi:hypothetical protein